MDKSYKDKSEEQAGVVWVDTESFSEHVPVEECSLSLCFPDQK